MSDLLWQGLTISVVGMGLTFAVLVVLILTITLLKHFLPGSGRSETEPDKKLAVSRPPPDTDEEIAAAIAVALLHLRAADSHPGDLGATLEAEHGPWWLVGRN